MAILIVALALRMANLGGKSLWIDEVFSVLQSRRSTAAIFAGIGEPNHPPGYYLLLHYWPTNSDFSARLPSALASTVGVWLLFLLASRWAGRQTALVAAAILAVSPLDIWYAQEARMFALATVAVLLAALGLSRRTLPGAAMLTAGLGLGLYSYYAVVPLWLGLSAVWAVWWWRGPRDHRSIALWSCGSLIAFLSFLPLWPRLFDFVGRLGDVFGVASFLQLAGFPPPPAWIYPLMLAMAVVGTAMIAWHGPRMLGSSSGRWLGAVIISGFVLATVLTPIPRVYSAKRVLVIGWPYVTLLVAWVIVHRSRWPATTIRVVLAVSLAAALVGIALVPKTDFRGVAAYLDRAASPADIVWMDADLLLMTYRYYEPSHLGRAGGPGALRNVVATDRRVWYLAYRCPPCGISLNQTLLDADRKLRSRVPFDQLELRLYE